MTGICSVFVGIWFLLLSFPPKALTAWSDFSSETGSDAMSDDRLFTTEESLVASLAFCSFLADQKT